MSPAEEVSEDACDSPPRASGDEPSFVSRKVKAKVSAPRERG